MSINLATPAQPLVSTADPDVVIQVEHVYKRYSRHEARASLRHELTTVLKRLAGMVAPKPEAEPFYALQDITFTIRRGESVAIVGRNGSGKTTLLRILSGITRPTRGIVKVDGRFTSLIALGAGFIPEMTGRRNIYLNAAIHGVSPAEIEPFIQKIIAFSELQDFIDDPVKHYSSGMYARLGFSIAIHLAPEIIFLDEILAVGDQQFQEKCFARILQFKEESRTLVFVSHSPVIIKQICERGIWLNAGHQMMDGPVDEVLDAYIQSLA